MWIYLILIFKSFPHHELLSKPGFSILGSIQCREALGKLLKSWCLDHTRINEIKMSGEDSSTNISLKLPRDACYQPSLRTIILSKENASLNGGWKYEIKVSAGFFWGFSPWIIDNCLLPLSSPGPSVSISVLISSYQGIILDQGLP